MADTLEVEGWTDSAVDYQQALVLQSNAAHAVRGMEEQLRLARVELGKRGAELEVAREIFTDASIALGLIELETVVEEIGEDEDEDDSSEDDDEDDSFDDDDDDYDDEEDDE